MAIWERRHYFIGNFEEEAAFNWLFERGGIIYWVNLGRLHGVFFFIHVQNYAGGWLKFYFMDHALPRGLVI